MQGAYLRLTIGIQFFLLVGYLFYWVFRKYGEREDRISMMKCILGLVSVLTAGLIISITLVASRMVIADLVVAVAFLIVDVIGLYLLWDDSQRLSRNSLIVEQT